MLQDSQCTSAPSETVTEVPAISPEQEKINRILAVIKRQAEHTELRIRLANLEADIPKEFVYDNRVNQYFWELGEDEIHEHGIAKLAGYARIASDNLLDFDDLLTLTEHDSYEDAMAEMVDELQQKIQYKIDDPLSEILSCVESDALEYALNNSGWHPLELRWLEDGKHYKKFLSREIK